MCPEVSVKYTPLGIGGNVSWGIWKIYTPGWCCYVKTNTYNGSSSNWKNIHPFGGNVSWGIWKIYTPGWCCNVKTLHAMVAAVTSSFMGSPAPWHKWSTLWTQNMFEWNSQSIFLTFLDPLKFLAGYNLAKLNQIKQSWKYYAISMFPCVDISSN